MTEAFIGIGSNLGDRVENCLKALQMLQHQPGITLIKVSSFYETEPVEVEGGWFVNGAVKIETSLGPRELLSVLQEIEGRLGRSPRRERGEPRTIDLDILLYDRLVVESPDLVIPHPRMHERRFVLLPLSEIAGEAKHPVLNRTAEELLHQLQDSYQVRRLLGAGCWM